MKAASQSAPHQRARPKSERPVTAATGRVRAAVTT